MNTSALLCLFTILCTTNNKYLFEFFAVLIFFAPDSPLLVEVGDDLGGQTDVVPDDLFVDGQTGNGTNSTRQITVHNWTELAIAKTKSVVL